MSAATGNQPSKTNGKLRNTRDASRKYPAGVRVDRYVAREPGNIVMPPLVTAYRLLLRYVSAGSFLTQRFVIRDSSLSRAPPAVAPQPVGHGWCAWDPDRSRSPE
jgi:hypothetical protein